MFDTYLLHPEKFDAIWDMLKRISKSNLLPDDFQAAKVGEEIAAANLLTPYTFACRMGMDLMQVCQSMHKINGKLTLSAQMIIAAINSSGKFIGPYYKFLEDKHVPGRPCACYCYGYRKSEPDHVLTGSIITIDTAKQEGWVLRQGSKWDTMTGQMLRYRAVTIWARAYCPEILMGFLHSSEEMEEGDNGYDMSQEILVPPGVVTKDKTSNEPDEKFQKKSAEESAKKSDTSLIVSTSSESPLENEKTKIDQPLTADDTLPDSMLDAWAEEFETENTEEYNPSDLSCVSEREAVQRPVKKRNYSGGTRTRRIRKELDDDGTTSTTKATTQEDKTKTTQTEEAVDVQEAPKILP